MVLNQMHFAKTQWPNLPVSTYRSRQTHISSKCRYVSGYYKKPPSRLEHQHRGEIPTCEIIPQSFLQLLNDCVHNHGWLRSQPLMD